MLGRAPVSSIAGAMRKAAAAEQAQQVELALGPHLVERLVVGEVDDLDDQPLAQAAKCGRQVARRRRRRARRCRRGSGARATASAPIRAWVMVASVLLGGPESPGLHKPRAGPVSKTRDPGTNQTVRALAGRTVEKRHVREDLHRRQPRAEARCGDGAPPVHAFAGGRFCGLGRGGDCRVSAGARGAHRSPGAPGRPRARFRIPNTRSPLRASSATRTRTGVGAPRRAD